jgi:hypothetical protein
VPGSWLLLRHHGFLRGGVHLLLMPLRAAAQLLRGRPGRLRTTRDGRDDAVGAVGPGTAHRALAAGGWELFVAREKVLDVKDVPFIVDFPIKNGDFP